MGKFVLKGEHLKLLMFFGPNSAISDIVGEIVFFKIQSMRT
jgi:hypothetical protein